MLLLAVLALGLAGRARAQYELPPATQLDNIADAIAGQQRMIEELENVLRKGNSPFGDRPMTPDEVANLTRDLAEKQQRVRDLQNQAQNLQDQIRRNSKAPTQGTPRPDAPSTGNNTRPGGSTGSSRTRPIDLPDAPGGTRPPRLPSGGSALDAARDAFRAGRDLRRIVPTPLDVAIDGSIMIVSEEVDALLAISDAHDREDIAQKTREQLDQRIREEVREMYEDPERRQALNPVYELEELQTLAVINSHQGNDILSELIAPGSREALVENLSSLSPDAVDWRAEVREELRTQVTETLSVVADVAEITGQHVADKLEEQARGFIFGDKDRLEDTLAGHAMDLLEGAANDDGEGDSETAGGPPAGNVPPAAGGGEIPAEQAPLQIPSANDLLGFIGQMLPPANDELPERPEVAEGPLHPPGQEPVGGVPGNGEELCGGVHFNLPAAVNPEQPGAIDFGDIDLEAIRNGVAQTIEDLKARANFRTDADREQASRLESELQAAEEAWRRRVEQYNRMVQEQINEALLEEQRRRVQAAFNHLQTQHQNFSSYYQQHSPQGKQTATIRDQ